MLCDLPISLPPATSRLKSSAVSKRFTFADRLETRLAQARAELVPQDPVDEHAAKF